MSLPNANTNATMVLDPEIGQLFKDNEKSDLVRMLSNRSCLNKFKFFNQLVFLLLL